MITYAMRSKPGNRDYNEDSIRMREEGNNRLFVLADGLGGCGHGELASQTASEAAIARFRWDLQDRDFLGRAIESAQSAVLERQRVHPEAEKMSTTMVMLRMTQSTAQWIHIGDSRMYMFRDDKVASQTIDHSVPQMLVNMGEITPDEIRHHPDRNRLLHIVGRPWRDKKYVLSETVEIEPGDAFLLCTDGFWEYITEKEMCQELKAAEDVAEWLDNMTVIVEKNGKGSNMDNYSAICVMVE